MIVRLRRYRSPEEASYDLARLGFDLPAPVGRECSALFLEGPAGRLRSLNRRIAEIGPASFFSDDGHHPRLVLVGGEDDLLSRAATMLKIVGVEAAFRSYRSNDAPPVKYPGGELNFDRPLVMGVLNVTPDSFSGDGAGGNVDASVLKALAMFEEGADIIDVGGESTRPGATPVPVAEELKRTIPVIGEIAARTDVPISVDTMKPEVAEAAMRAGARIINDISGLGEPRIAQVAAEAGAPVVITHMLGTPQTMQQAVNENSYDDVISAIMWRWEERMALGEARGLSRQQVILDPGIGFGKLQEHNLEILDRTRELRCAGRPVLIGASRKGFVSRIAGDTAERRLGGSVGAAVLAALNGASIVRAHDVPETVGALRLVEAVRQRFR